MLLKSDAASPSPVSLLSSFSLPPLSTHQAFRCAYCYFLNPARKTRPQAPRLPEFSYERRLRSDSRSPGPAPRSVTDTEESAPPSGGNVKPRFTEKHQASLTKTGAVCVKYQSSYEDQMWMWTCTVPVPISTNGKNSQTLLKWKHTQRVQHLQISSPPLTLKLTPFALLCYLLHILTARVPLSSHQFDSFPILMSAFILGGGRAAAEVRHHPLIDRCKAVVLENNWWYYGR